MPRMKRKHPADVPFYGPKSLCICGHSGDGTVSDHMDRLGGLAPGHGACKVKGCSCEHFQWKEWTKEFVSAKLSGK